MRELPQEPTPAQRALMDRARAAAERDREKPPRRVLAQVVGLMLALSVVGTVAFGFDRFLTGMQKLMHVLQEQDKAEADRKAREPMPAYIVPDAPPAREPEPAPAKPE